MYLLYLLDVCMIFKIILYKKNDRIIRFWFIYVEINKIFILRYGDILGYWDVNRKYLICLYNNR